MNERIKALTEKAGIVPVALHTDPLVVSYHLSYEMLDRYTQLVIKECIDINREELSFVAFNVLIDRYHEKLGVKI